MVNSEDLKTLDPTSSERLSPNAPSTKNDPLKTPVKSRSNTISVRTDSKSFDAFLSSIPKVQSLTEAKRLRNDVDREMRTLKNSALLSGRTVTDEQRRKEEAHLKRLERARKRIDKRIEKLQGRSPGVSSDSSVTPFCH
jgi:sorting nexin-25